MRLLFRALSTVLLAALPAFAQSIPVTGSHVVNSAGTPLASGTLVITPTNLQQKPIAYRIGGGGTGMASQVSVQVTNGSFATTLPDVLLTNPINVCFKFSVQDPVTFNEDLPGFTCVQPSTQATSAAVKSGWCSATGCNLDLYVPTQLPGVPVTSGPQGLRGVKGNPGCLLGSTCNTISFNSIAGVTAAAGDGVTDDSTAVKNACAANADLWITAPYAFASPATLSCNLHFIDTGELLPQTGVSIVINGKVDSGPRQIFGGLGAIVLNAGQKDALAEWFGAVPDGTLTGGGTDNTVALQKGINALTTGNLILRPFIYATSGNLIVNKSGVGVAGQTTGFSLPQFGSPAISTIVSNSPSADILDVVGTAAQKVYWGHIEHLALTRSVLPTGTAAGLSMSFTCGMPVTDVESGDSIRDYYFHGASACGQGGFSNLTAGWGYTGLTYGAGELDGFYLDSQDGVAENTLTMFHGAVSGAGGSTTTYGLKMIGTAINDVDLDTFETAGADYGMWIEYTGPNPASPAYNAYDIQIRNATIDESRHTGITVKNVYAKQLGAVSIEGGHVLSFVSPNGYGIDIEGSSGVNVGGGIQIGGTQQANIYAANSQDLRISDFQIKYNAGYNGVQFNNTVDSAVTDGTIDGGGGGGVLVAMTGGSVQNVIGPLNLTGIAGTGYYADATSGANVVLPSSINPAHITTLETGNVNGACRFTGTPRVSMQPGAGTNPGYAAGQKTFLDVNAANNDCSFQVLFTAGSAPPTGVLDPSSSTTPLAIFNVIFQTYNGTPLTWPFKPVCSIRATTSAASALGPMFVQTNPNLMSLDLGPGAVLTPGSTYGFAGRCALE